MVAAVFRSAASAAIFLCSSSLAFGAHQGEYADYGSYGVKVQQPEQDAARGPVAGEEVAAPGFEYEPPVNDQVTYAPHEPYLRSAVPTSLLPQVYGVKVFLFGLTLLLTLCYLAIKEDGSFRLQAGVAEALQAKDKKEAVKTLAKEVGTRVGEIFKGLSDPRMYGFIFAIICVLSGLTEMFKSLRRRRKAKKGQVVSYAPPLRAAGMVHLGIVLQLISIFGVFFTSLPHFFGIMNVSAAIVVSAALLFLSSSYERHKFKSRMKASSTVAPFH